MFANKSYLVLLLLFKLYLTDSTNEQCSIRDTCTNSSLLSPSIYNDESFIQSRNCFCDSVCEEYGDCCHSSETKKYECIDFLLPTVSNEDLPSTRLFVWMRTECLSIYIGSKVDIECRNLNNQSFDTNPILFIPVTSSQTNITYRNYYCAYCNNDVNDKSIHFWEYKPFCHGQGTEKDNLILNNDQQVQYYIYNLTRNCSKTIRYPRKRLSSQPSVFIRPCKKSLPSTCPLDTPIDLARNCSSFNTAYRYVRNSSIIYRNSYCAECNRRNTSNEITCLDPYLRSSFLTLPQSLRNIPLSILFDPELLKSYLNNNTIPRIIYSIDYNCTKPNELYDLFEKTCKEIENSNEEFIISMKCSNPVQTLIQSNDKIYYENGSLYLVNYSILLTKNEYVFVSNNRIVFCDDQWRNSNVLSMILPTFPLYRNILSIVCTSISLGCLFLFGIIFYLIPSLQNLPGKCLLFLSISLFLGQSIFISVSTLTEYHSVCIASAILIHYFYLSSFVWLLIISIHIHSTFAHQTIEKNSINKSDQHLIIYNLLVWCSSGLIILIACLIQFLIPQSNFSPGYGLIYCSISKPNAMIIFFLVPIGCILLIVGSLFFKTLLTIYRSHQIAKLATQTSSSISKDNNLIYVYARLASLMGMQWILLIGALAIRQTWSWIIFEIINSLPGLFICFGFLCSKKVFNILKEKCSMKILVRRNSSRSNTTSSSMLMSRSLPPINTTK